MKTSLPKLLLILLLPSMLMSGFALKNTEAQTSFNTWGALHDLNVPNGEYGYEWYICYLVPTWLPGDWFSANNYEDNTNSGSLYEALFFTESYGMYSANLWVGDYWPDVYDPAPDPTQSKWGWGFCSGGSAREMGDHPWDYEIYNYANMFGPSNQYSTFIWTCACGGTYFRNTDSGTHYGTGPPNYNNYYGCFDTEYNRLVGMPYAWTGTLGMSLNGYNQSDNGDYVYIGWENNSPFLMNYAPQAWTINYYFLYMYHYFGSGHVDGNWHTMHDSLDYASRFVFNPNQNFQNCKYDEGWYIDPNHVYYSRMRVFGNSISPGP